MTRNLKHTCSFGINAANLDFISCMEIERSRIHMHNITFKRTVCNEVNDSYLSCWTHPPNPLSHTLWTSCVLREDPLHALPRKMSISFSYHMNKVRCSGNPNQQSQNVFMPVAASLDELICKKLVGSNWHNFFDFPLRSLRCTILCAEFWRENMTQKKSRAQIEYLHHFDALKICCVQSSTYNGSSGSGQEAVRAWHRKAMEST